MQQETRDLHRQLAECQKAKDIFFEGLIQSKSHEGWHERQKWKVEEQLENVQAQAYSLVETVTKVAEHLGIECEDARSITADDIIRAVAHKQSEELAAFGKELHQWVDGRPEAVRDQGFCKGARQSATSIMNRADKIRREAGHAHKLDF